MLHALRLIRQCESDIGRRMLEWDLGRDLRELRTAEARGSNISKLP